ncbi:phosphorothioated DNA-binding restriction endonuclease [Streptomyces alkaliphilus]|uniref:phosphorothioated DNA-binding restriction endonuclease n=1 Tax=Streptomyces alkaliphilus TaxID=1472722 RepID=UPI00117EE0BE|nr:restriction endonuclease [Streptomyces alkaliphilus]
MEREELFRKLAKLRRANNDGRRAPHKPLMLLWLINRFVEHGTTEVTYEELERPVGALIEEFGPPVKRPSRDRAAMPFVHLERELWSPSAGDVGSIRPDFPDRGSRLRAVGARGRLRPAVERLLADPVTLAEVVESLIDHHFTPALRESLLEAAGPGLTDFETIAARLVLTTRRPRDPAFPRLVLDAWGRACAMCGYDGRLAGISVGLEAAHIHWHSQRGPDRKDNGLALCVLHHRLFDHGVLGLTTGAEPRLRVSPSYEAETPAGRAVLDLNGVPLRRPADPKAWPAVEYLAWHDREVFRHAPAAV